MKKRYIVLLWAVLPIIQVFSQTNKYVNFELERYIIPWQNYEGYEFGDYRTSYFYKGGNDIITFHSLATAGGNVLSLGLLNEIPGQPLRDFEYTVQSQLFTSNANGEKFDDVHRTRYLGNGVVATLASIDVPNSGIDDYYLTYWKTSPDEAASIMYSIKRFMENGSEIRINGLTGIPLLIDEKYILYNYKLFSSNGNFYSNIFNDEVKPGDLYDNSGHGVFQEPMHEFIPVGDDRYLMVDGSRVSLVDHTKTGAQRLVATMHLKEGRAIDDFVLFKNLNLIVASIEGDIFMGSYEKGTFSLQIAKEDLGFSPYSLYNFNQAFGADFYDTNFHILLEGTFTSAVIDLHWKNAEEIDRYEILAYGRTPSRIIDQINNKLLMHRSRKGDEYNETLEIMNWSVKDKEVYAINSDNLVSYYVPEYGGYFIALPFVLNEEDYDRYRITYKDETRTYDSPISAGFSEEFNTAVWFLPMDEEAYDGWSPFTSDSLIFKAEYYGYDYDKVVEVGIPKAMLLQNHTAIKSDIDADVSTINFIISQGGNVLEISSTITVAKAHIFDINGKMVKTISNSRQMQVDITHLQRGVYIVQAELENGQRSQYKFIK